MSSITAGSHAHEDAHAHDASVGSFLSTYVFSLDHKVIGLQFLFSTLLWFLVGGLLALGIRWQLAYPWSNMPVLGEMLYPTEGGQIAPEFYTVLFTMHATVMIFFVIIPILAGAFGNYLIPLMIGADDMAFPTLNMLSYWFMWPAFICIGASFFTAGHGAAAGWTSYPPLSVVTESAPSSGTPQTLWLLGVTFVGVSSMMGSVNYMTTIIQMRAPGMTMFRLPLTIWAMFITAILQAFALPILTAAGFMQLTDRLLGTGFFLPEGLVVNNSAAASGGGQPLLWQHLFWFYSHPAVYIMILPAMGMVSDMLSCFSRKPVFGYKPMVYSISAIAGLGFIVWGHHMFVSGMNPVLGMTFMVATMMIALPSAVKVFNWLGTIWGGNLQFTTPMLFSLSFVSMFIIGGLSGIFMAATPVDIFIHDTYFIVAHFHYVLFGGTAMAVFGAIYFWYPKMFGRMMNETLGKIHFFLTFLFLNGTFYTMHILGVVGFPRRLADPYHYETFRELQPMNEFMTWCAVGMVACQVVFAFNFIYSMFAGKVVGRNPWGANSLEWMAPSPPGHGNFDFQPIVYRGPYEYGDPESDKDYYPQTQPPPEQRRQRQRRMTQIESQIERSRWPHAFAVVLACATFPLIWVGGLVTTYDAGMAVPDWPTTYGYNMFLYPISTWVSGPWDLFIEHGHRLLGSLAGLLTIALNVVIWKYDHRKWMRFAGLAALVLVISQGMLGGLRVRLSSTDFARAHGVTGPLFFAFTIVLCVMTSKFWWTLTQSANANESTPKRRTVIDGWLLFALAYCQLVLGAHLRHPNIDWSPGLFRMVVIFHLVAAFIVLLQAIQVAMRSRKLQSALRRPAWLLMILVLCQVGLGFATWRAKYGWPSFVPVAESKADQPLEIATHNALVGTTVQNDSISQAITVTGHVALGSLILATSVLYATRATYCFANQPAGSAKSSGVATKSKLSSTLSVIGGVPS